MFWICNFYIYLDFEDYIMRKNFIFLFTLIDIFMNIYNIVDLSVYNRIVVYVGVKNI